jgi:predicted NAD-dependent protein-ADP-ribosyltransferase YbiA (DUF1768 family)
MEKITNFSGDYAFLTMDYPCEIKCGDIVFKNAGTYLYALKTDDVGSMRKYARLSMNKARQKAANIINDNFTEDFEMYVMRACMDKFTQNPDLAKKLKATGDAELINVVQYNDPKLGVYMGHGENILGKVLTKIRSSIK